MTRRMTGTFLAVATLALLPATLYAEGTLFVEGGNVGIGTSTPTQPLHIQATNPLLFVETSGTPAERVLFRLHNNGKTRFEIRNTAAGISWTFDNDGNNFTISKVGTGVNELRLDGSGNLFLTGTVNTSSARSLKTGFVPVDSSEILAKVLSLPISEWSYKNDESAARHIGPLADDFYAAFALNDSDQAIATVDADGIALASIQALYDELLERDERITRLESELALLRQMMENR